MANIVTFFSAKGGQGKTTLAVHYALSSNSHFYTNNYTSGTEDVFAGLFAPGYFRIIKPGDKAARLEDKSVIDLGGFIDSKVPALIQAADLCVIPFCFGSRADIRALDLSVNSVAEINDHILIIINNTPKHLVPVADAGIRKMLGDKYPIYVVRQSTYLAYLADEGKNLFDLAGPAGPIGVAQKALTSVRQQLTDLFLYIGGY